MSAFVPIQLEVAEQVQPYFIYNRILLPTAREYYNFRIDYGYGYLLRRVRARWPMVNAAGTGLAPELYLELYSAGVVKARQAQPIPFDVQSTPGNRILSTSPVAPLTDGTGMPGNFKILNYLFPYGSNIEAIITGQNGTDPTYVDIVYEGYYVPEAALSLWGAGGKD